MIISYSPSPSKVFAELAPMRKGLKQTVNNIHTLRIDVICGISDPMRREFGEQKPVEAPTSTGFCVISILICFQNDVDYEDWFTS